MQVRPVALAIGLITALYPAWPSAEAEVSVFFGNLHSHTALSDGSGTPAEAYGAHATWRAWISSPSRSTTTRRPATSLAIISAYADARGGDHRRTQHALSDSGYRLSRAISSRDGRVVGLNNDLPRRYGRQDHHRPHRCC
jgi:hypothetical protein